MTIKNGSFTLESAKISGRELSAWAEEEAKSLSSKERDSMLEISFFAEDNDTDEITVSNVTAIISKGFFSLKLEIPYVLDALAEQYLPLECARFSKYLVKRRGDELVAYDMRVSKYIERVIENDVNLADLFEAIQTLRRLPKEAFKDE